MYLRFITQFINEIGQKETGLFNALAFIRNNPETQFEDVAKLDELYNWFKENLDAPEWFTRPQYRMHEYHSLSWFKDTAKEHIIKMQEIIEVLEKYDIIVERVTSKKPGSIFFEDKFQISAVSPNKKRVI